MADWPLLGGQDSEAIGSVGGGSDGTAITGGAADTKGSYTQLIAATAFDIQWVCVQIYADGTNSEFLVDIAIGAPTEQIIVENLYSETPQSGVGRVVVGAYAMPLYIPAGTEISARCQSSTASAVCDVNMIGQGAHFMPSAPASIVDTYGAVTASTEGTQIDPGTSLNTKGAWTQIVASTDRDIHAIVFSTGRSAQNRSLSDADFLVDIGVGASGNEFAIVKDYYFFTASSGDGVKNYSSPCFPVFIPAGSRLAARAQCSITGTDRLFGLIIHGSG